MIRVKDNKASLEFYQEIMGKYHCWMNHLPALQLIGTAGMTLLRISENASNGFNLYFLGYPGKDGVPKEIANGVNPMADREGILELTWNYGTEKDSHFKYHNGNDEPQGFGHICVAVDNLDAACKRFEEKGVNWKKRLTDGRMKDIAFVLDPDNYWIEVSSGPSVSSRLFTDHGLKGDPK